MDDITLFHKTAGPNVKLLFWDRDCSDLSQFLITTNVLLLQSLISVTQIFLLYLLGCRGFPPCFSETAALAQNLYPSEEGKNADPP